MPKLSRPTRAPFPLVLLGAVLAAPAPALAQQAGDTVLPVDTGPVAEVEVSAPADSGEGSAESGYRASNGWVGPLGKVSLRDTPFSLNVTSGELVENSGAHSLSAALATNPTIFVAQSQLTDTRGMNDAIIRGFSPTYLKDGLYTNSYNMPLVENLERIEVLNGPSAFLYGYVNPGGTVNYLTKKPTATPVASATLGYWGGGQAFGAVDLGGAIDPGVDRVTYRLNAFRSDGGTFVNGQSLNSTQIAAAVDLRVAPETVIKPHFYHTEFRQEGAQAQFLLASGVKVPSTPDPTKLYGQSWSLNQVVSNQMGLGFESKLSEVFSLRADYNYSDMLWNDEMIKSTLTDDNGSYSQTYRYFGPQHYTTHTGYALLDAKFATGSIDHNVTFGYWGQNENDDDADGTQVSLGSFSLSSVGTVARPNVDVSDNAVSHIEWYYNSVLLGDRITLSPSWSVLAGANQTFVHELYKDTTTNTVSEQFEDSKLSPAAAVIYKPTPMVSTYLSYMEGLEFGDQAPDTAANALAILAPSTSRQYELGAKATLGRLDLAAALFHIDKVNAETDPNDNVYKQDGREIHRGLEVTVTGKPTDRLTLTGGFTVLDAYIDKASANPATEGKTPIDVPERMARLRGEYEIPGLSGLFITGAANYLGRRPVDVLNTQYLDDVVTFDAGMRWEPEVYGHKAKLLLSVDNLFDKAYWVSYTSRNGLQFGEPRTLSLSTKLTW